MTQRNAILLAVVAILVLAAAGGAWYFSSRASGTSALSTEDARVRRAEQACLSNTDSKADVKLYMPADIGDKFWRGEYNLGVGLAKGQVKAKGPVNKILKLVPLTKPLFPIYREIVAEKDAGK